MCRTTRRPAPMASSTLAAGVVMPSPKRVLPKSADDAARRLGQGIPRRLDGELCHGGRRDSGDEEEFKGLANERTRHPAEVPSIVGEVETTQLAHQDRAEGLLKLPAGSRRA